MGRHNLVRIATALAVHRVRAGLDPLGLTADVVAGSSEEELLRRLETICEDAEAAQMVRIAMRLVGTDGPRSAD
jgi:hypothetical protein